MSTSSSELDEFANNFIDDIKTIDYDYFHFCQAPTFSKKNWIERFENRIFKYSFINSTTIEPIYQKIMQINKDRINTYYHRDLLCYIKFLKEIESTALQSRGYTFTKGEYTTFYYVILLLLKLCNGEYYISDNPHKIFFIEDLRKFIIHMDDFEGFLNHTKDPQLRADIISFCKSSNYYICKIKQYLNLKSDSDEKIHFDGKRQPITHPYIEYLCHFNNPDYYIDQL